jgi:hypothetical protein
VREPVHEAVHQDISASGTKAGEIDFS